MINVKNKKKNQYFVSQSTVHDYHSVNILPH